MILLWCRCEIIHYALWSSHQALSRRTSSSSSGVKSFSISNSARIWSGVLPLIISATVLQVKSSNDCMSRKLAACTERKETGVSKQRYQYYELDTNNKRTRISWKRVDLSTCTKFFCQRSASSGLVWFVSW